MKDKKRINKYLNIIFVFYLVIYTTMIFIKDVKTDKYQFEEMTKVNQFYAYFVMSIIYLVMFLKSIISNFIIVILFIGIKLGFRMHRNELIYKENIKDSLTYYRDKLRGYSPAELSYLNNYDLNIKRDIVTTVLMLKVKHKIDIQDNKIKIIDEADNNLNENEKFIFEKIRNNDSVFSQNDLFRQAVIEDTINDGLLMDKQQIKVKLIKQIIFIIIGYLVLILSNILLSNFFLNRTYNIENNPLLSILVGGLSFVSMFLVIIVSLYPFFAIIATITYYVKNMSLSYVRTRKGKDLLNKALALERFLNDFGNVENEQLEYINIWDEYLVYSILFDHNQKALQECLNAVNNNYSKI